MKDLQVEREKLNYTIATIQEVIKNEKDNLNKLDKKLIDDNDELWNMVELKKIHLSNLEISLEQPYFARIDFISEVGNKKHTVYIGKNGVMKDSEIIVTDWRAPISSLYYDAEVGECSFDSPDGVVKGNMSLKRQYEIENKELIEYFDIDLVSNDILLRKYLNSNNDARLKSIVATIQKEQNEVIRKKIFENLIIQGVAGSGKTTVALHRIAYLVYNYLNSIKQSQYLVIGPNPVFLKYIKSVLPELDVSSVRQCTFEQFAKEYINEEINIISSNKKVMENINGSKNNTDKFKSSMEYKKMVDEFLKSFLNNLTANDLKLGNFVVLKRETIKQVFESTQSAFNTSLKNRIDITIDKLCDLIEKKYDSIFLKYNDYSYEMFNKATKEEQVGLKKQFVKDKDELKKNCRTTLRKYFAKVTLSPTKLYKLFINSLSGFNFINHEYINDLKKETLVNIKRNNYDFEDLSALIYIKLNISPKKEYEKYKHVVIDEAQDLGKFNFYILKNVLPNATFSIFGDLAQSIYDYRGINSWEVVNEIMFNNNGQIVNFNKSYRTTAEIMNIADNVSSSIGLGRSDMVIRHGNPVNITKVDNLNEISLVIMQKIIDFQNKGYKTIAVISKTDLLSSALNADLAERGLNIPNVSVNDDLAEDKFKICTISNYLAKGLEFDAVIINNASEENYSSDNNLDMKLLYVAITRALHELDIVYYKDLTKPLKIRKK